MRASQIARSNPRRTSFFQRRWNQAADRIIEVIQPQIEQAGLQLLEAADMPPHAENRLIWGLPNRENVEDMRQAVLAERQRHLHGGPVNQDVDLESQQVSRKRKFPVSRKRKRQLTLNWKSQKLTGPDRIIPAAEPNPPPISMDLDLNQTIPMGIPSHSIYLNRWDLVRRRKKLLRLKVSLLKKLKNVLIKKPFINKKKK